MTHHASPAEAAILTAAIAWRRSLDVALTALNVPARMLVEAVDTHTWRALNDARGFTEYMSGNSYAESYPGDDPACRPPANATAEVAGVRFSCTSCKCDVDVFRVQCGRCKFDAERSSYGLDERTPGQQATDYAATAEHERQLVASRAEAKREVERLRGELTREQALVAELKREQPAVGIVDWQKMAAHLEAERDSLRAKVHGLTAEFEAVVRRRAASDEYHSEVVVERDALLVTVRMMARAT